MSGGLKEHWGIGDPAQVPPDAQSQGLKAAFEPALDGMAEQLQYTAVNGEREPHAALASRAEALVPRYQGALGEVDPADESKARPSIQRLLGDAAALAREVAGFRSQAEEALDEWQSRADAHDTALRQLQELADWQDPQEAALRSLADAIGGLVNERSYARASTQLDEFLPRLQPVYDEMQRQKAAQQQYEPALAALQPALQAAGPNADFPSLAPMEQEIDALRGRMEAAAQAKDFAQALDMAQDLLNKTQAHAAALAKLQEQKNAYQAGFEALKAGLAQASQSGKPGLADMQRDMLATQQSMEAAAGTGDYEQAGTLLGELKPQLDAVLAAQAQAGPSAAPDAKARKTGHDIPWTKIPIPATKYAFLGGKIELSCVGTIEASAHVELDDSDKTDLGGLGIKVADAWWKDKGDPVLKNSGLADNFKIGRDKLSIKAATSTKTQLGTLKLELTFAGMELKREGAKFWPEPKVLSGEISLEDSVVVEIGSMEVLGLQFTNIKGRAGFKTTIEPNVAKIVWDLLKDRCEALLKEIAETLTVTVSAEVVITGSFIVAGVATVAGAIYQVVQGFEIGDLAKSYTPAVNATQAGFRAGMAGAAAPGDKFGNAGYAEGRKNFDALLARTRQDNPTATDEAIQAAVAARADEALQQVSGAIDTRVRSGIWDAYLTEHKAMLMGDNARWAYVACFGREPDSAHPDIYWQQYMLAHPTLAKLSPV